MGQRLHVVHQGGPPLDAALVRPWRGEGRLARPAVQVLDDRGLLAGDVPAGDAGQADRHRVEAGRLPFGHGVVQLGQQVALPAVHAQVRLAGVDRAGGQRDPVQNQVRQPGQQQPVLAAGRLALGAVGDHHRLAGGVRDRPHLAPGRKPGAAPASEPGPLHEVDQPFGALPAGPPALCLSRPRASRPPPHWQRPVRSLVRAQVGDPVIGHPGQQPWQAGVRAPVGGPLERGHRAPARAVLTSRHVVAAATAAVQPMVSANTQTVSRSVPIPRPCARAMGQHA